MAHTLQDRYSKLIDKKLQATLVTKSGLVFNDHYEGDATGGKVKIPVRSTEVTVGDYDKATGMTLTTGTTTYVDLSLDYDKAVNEIIDGYDASAVPDDIVAERLDSAGYALGLVEDTVSLRELELNGLVYEDPEPVTSDTVYETIIALRTQLSNNNVPTEGRWLIVTPEVYGMLLNDTTHFIRQGELSENLIASGAIGKIAGFTVFESSLLMKENTQISDGQIISTEMIAGHPNWCHRVEEWSVPVAVKELTNTYIGASAVQGRKIFGVKVSNKRAVAIKRIEE